MTRKLNIASTSVGPPATTWAGTGAGAGAVEAAGGADGGEGILGMSVVCSLTVGRATAVAALEAGASGTTGVAVVGGAWTEGTVVGAWTG